MSTPSDPGFDLEDLELQLLPAWARQSPDTNRYARYEGGEAPESRHRDRVTGRTGRPPRGDRRTQRDPRPGPRRHEGGVRPAARHREEKPESPQPLPDVSVTLVPEEKGVESLARQIKLTGRAYPMFDIAYLVLKKPDRYHVTFGVNKTPDARIAQQLWLCNLDETVWLSEPEAVNHVLKRHFDTFYKAERTPTDPPKGTYTFVAQCGLSGTVLGPPNYHDYQNKLRKLHAERFSRMPFDAYKSKVRIVKDEAVVKKWIEDQSWKTEFVCLNVPEAKKLASREEVEKHFREVHVANILKTVDSFTVNGAAAQQLPAQPLRLLLRRAWDEQQRFPLKIVTALSQQFATHGLQFFKVNKTVTHVSVARPHYLDLEATPVSEGVKRIVEFINATPKCTRRKLLDALSPSPASSPSPATCGPGDTIAATGESPPTAESTVPTPEQTAVIADLHWLIHQGHVIEFANGKIETAKKPLPRPPKFEPKPVEPPAGHPSASEETPATAQVDIDPGPVPNAQAAPESVPGASEATPSPTAPDDHAASPTTDARTGLSSTPSEPADTEDPTG